MCFASAPPAPPPVPPAPTAMDYAAGTDVLQAQSNDRKKAAAMAGYQSTIKTGAGGDTSQAPTTKKVLLGG